MPTRREIIKSGALGAGLLTMGACANGKEVRSQPNILFILADDLGYADLSCYGQPFYQTPELDRLAADGLLFTQAYANSAVCSATRTALITGRYQYRLPVGLEEPIPSAQSKLGMPPSHPTLPSLLKACGYRTGLFGKWHLGVPPEYGPLRSGYDHFFGFFLGALDYFRHESGVTEAQKGPYTGLFEDDHPVHVDGYLTDLLADRAIDFIKRGDQRPFLASLHFNAPHWPWEGPADEAVSRQLKALRHEDGGNLAIYAKMVGAMDAAVGRVLAALKTKGVERDTIVVFTSDNGGERFSDVWPFTGMKGELLEGGLRIPCILRWPAGIAAGRRSDQVIASMDWLPTLLTAAGGAPSPSFPPDGDDLLPVVMGTKPSHPRKLFWRYRANQQSALRDGNWKYLKILEREYLFDVVTDQRERANLKDKFPEIFDRLKSDYARWDATMLPYPAVSFSETPKGHMPDRY